jgi:hypothetical protein
MVQQGIRTEQEQRKELERNQKGKTGGRKKRLETLCPVTCVK